MPELWREVCTSERVTARNPQLFPGMGRWRRFHKADIRGQCPHFVIPLALMVKARALCTLSRSLRSPGGFAALSVLAPSQGLRLTKRLLGWRWDYSAHNRVCP